MLLNVLTIKHYLGKCLDTQRHTDGESQNSMMDPASSDTLWTACFHFYFNTFTVWVTFSKTMYKENWRNLAEATVTKKQEQLPSFPQIRWCVNLFETGHSSMLYLLNFVHFSFPKMDHEKVNSMMSDTCLFGSRSTQKALNKQIICSKVKD